jgi:site-specific DNA-methyltransferase (adenine-specific)
MTKDASFFLNMGSSNIDPWVSYDVANQARDLFHLQNNIAWVKSVSIGENTYGHFKPINSNRFINHTFEHIFHFTKDGNVPVDRLAVGVPYADKSNIKRWKGVKADKRCKGNTWFIPYKTIRLKTQKGTHPAIFPEELVENCFKLHGFNDKTVVLDPFLGTGTTLVVAKRLGISGIGMDIDKDYIRFAETRLSELNSAIFT